MTRNTEQEVRTEPDSINEFAVVGEFGFKRFEGPWSVEKSGTNWAIILPYEEMDTAPGSHDEGQAAVLVADGEVVGGGIVDSVYDPQDEGETHVIVDQYAIGDAP